MDEDYLENAGLSQNQAKIYLALLKRGTSSASKLSTACVIDRRNAYDGLAKLQELGLVSSIKIGNSTAFNAAPPERLLSLLEEEKREIEKRTHAIVQVLPVLKKLGGQRSESDVKVFYGKQGIKGLFEDVLETVNSGETYYTFGGTGKTREKLMIFVKKFHKRRKEKGFALKFLMNEEGKKVGQEISREPNTELRYVPREYSSPATVQVYDSKVNLFLWSEEPIGIQVKNKEIAQAFKSFFKLMWRNAKK